LLDTLRFFFFSPPTVF